MFDVQDEHVATLCADEEMAAVLGEAALSDLLAPVWLCVCVCVCVCVRVSVSVRGWLLSVPACTIHLHLRVHLYSFILYYSYLCSAC